MAVIDDEHVILSDLRRALNPVRIYLGRTNPVRWIAPLRVRQLGVELQRIISDFNTEADARVTAITPTAIPPYRLRLPAPYRVDGGLDLLNRLHQELEQFRNDLNTVDAADRGHIRFQELNQHSENLLNVIEARRDSLVQPTIDRAQKIEKKRLFILRHEFGKFYRRGATPPNLDPDILQDYEDFLREIEPEIIARLNQINPPAGAPPAPPYDAANGAASLTNLENRFRQKRDELQEQRDQANDDARRLPDPAARAAAARRRDTIDEVLRVHPLLQSTVSTGRRDLNNIHNMVSTARPAAPPPPPPATPIRDFFRAAAQEIVSFVAGAAIGAGVKAAFMAAALMVTGPVGIIGGLAIAMTGGALAGAATKVFRNRRNGHSWRDSLREGVAISAAVGFVGGAAGYGLMHYFGGDLFGHSTNGGGGQPPGPGGLGGTSPPGGGAPNPTPILPPVGTGNSLNHAQDLLRHTYMPPGAHLSAHTQALVDKAISSNATALDAMMACKEVSFEQINTVQLLGHNVVALQDGYELTKAGWDVAGDNGLTGNPWGKMLGLDYAYGQDIGAPGMPHDHIAATKIANDMGYSPWMNRNPWRAALNLG